MDAHDQHDTTQDATSQTNEAEYPTEKVQGYNSFLQQRLQLQRTTTTTNATTTVIIIITAIITATALHVYRCVC